MLRCKKLCASIAVFFVLLSSSVTILVNAQVSWVVWSQTYEGTTAYSVVETPDGGYALGGSTSVIDPNGDFLLIKTDGSGNVEWNQTYLGTDYDFCYSMIATSDGGYALAGYRQYVNVDGTAVFWFVKTDSSGNMEWNKVFSGGGIDHASSVIETSDGGYVILGSKYTLGANYADAWLIKTDELGNIEWDQSYGGTFRELANTLIETSDGGIAFACYTYLFGAGATDFWLVKTDDSGEMEWNRFYGSPEHEIAYSLVENSDGGYTLAGSQQIWVQGEQKILVIRTNIQGVPEFPSWTILPILTTATLLIITCKHKLPKNRQHIQP